jgi:type I restriction enzyme, S subunit
MLPPDWEMHDLSVLADYRAGRTPPRANPIFWEGDSPRTPWVAISDMTEHGVVSNTSETVTQAAYDTVFRGRLSKAGTLLMSFKLTIGRISTLGVDAFHNEAIISIFPKHGVDQRFLGYWLSQVDYDGLHDRQIKGNTLNQDKIDRIAVAKPPLPEQQNIADVLDHVRQGIETQRAQFKIATELKRAVMREVFTRGLRGEAQKDSEIGPVPESWDVVPLGSLGRVGNGSTPKKNTSDYWSGGTFPWLTSAKVYDRNIAKADQFVTELALAECHLPIVQPGAILVAITGQGKTLGHCAVLNIAATTNQHIAYLATNLSKAVPSFVRGYLETQYDYFRQVGSGGGSTKGALTCAFLRDLPIPLPPTLDEQSEITAILDAIDAKIDLHKRKKAVLEELFRALLHKLMTGSIRVAELDLSALNNEVTA